MSIYNVGSGDSISGCSLVYLSSNKNSISLTAQSLTDTFTITYDGDGDLTVTSSDTSIVTVALVSGTTYRVTAAHSVQGNVTITVSASIGSRTIPANKVTIDVTADTLIASRILNDNDWDVISLVSADGVASNYWAVGDRKAVILNGKIGDSPTFSNTTLYVYILGINHNGSTGITFGGFKTALTGGVDVALVDSVYASTMITGKYFCINYSGNNDCGWARSRIRYEVLGSTDSSSRGDASSTTATSPVSGTLMAVLPSTLRAVMKPMTVWSDNRTSVYTPSISATVDYLPLLAEYEVRGGRTYGSADESYNGRQAQYQYYKNGNSKVKYKHNATSTSCIWWLRTAPENSGYSDRFCIVNESGEVSMGFVKYSYGVAPIFFV